MMEEAARSQGMGGLQEPEKARKRISPEASQKELSPDDILAQWDLCQNFDLQNCKTINLWYFKWLHMC